MDIMNVTIENIEREHICCAISEKKGENCADSKKDWMKQRYADGLVFKKLDVRGKVFIEYMPAENAWCPIEADGYMFINCFWVSGQYKGQGHANRLLEACKTDAMERGAVGIIALSSKKKMPFLSDPGYLKHKGFQLADTADPYFELLYLPFAEGAPVPRFKECAKHGVIPEGGIVLYYSNQCPHTEKYAGIFKKAAEEKGIAMNMIRITSKEAAQSAPSPFTTYSLFYDGKFVGNEILSETKISRFLEGKAL